MKTLNRFVDLAAVDPAEATRLAPGVRMLVSSRTFAEIAAEHRFQLPGAHPRDEIDPTYHQAQLIE